MIQKEVSRLARIAEGGLDGLGKRGGFLFRVESYAWMKVLDIDGEFRLMTSRVRLSLFHFSVT
jgi:hypothetical protein